MALLVPWHGCAGALASLGKAVHVVCCHDVAIQYYRYDPVALSLTRLNCTWWAGGSQSEFGKSSILRLDPELAPRGPGAAPARTAL
jgi:hypothetical protein